MKKPDRITRAFDVIDDELITIRIEYEEILNGNNYINISQTTRRPGPGVILDPLFESIRLEVKHFKDISNLLYNILDDKPKKQ